MPGSTLCCGEMPASEPPEPPDPPPPPLVSRPPLLKSLFTPLHPPPPLGLPTAPPLLPWLSPPVKSPPDLPLSPPAKSSPPPSRELSSTPPPQSASSLLTALSWELSSAPSPPLGLATSWPPSMLIVSPLSTSSPMLWLGSTSRDCVVLEFKVLTVLVVLADVFIVEILVYSCPPLHYLCCLIVCKSCRSRLMEALPDLALWRLSLPEARPWLYLALESLGARALLLVSQDLLASMSCFLHVRVKVIRSFQVDCLGWSSVDLLTALVRIVAAVCSLFHDVSFMYPAISSFSSTFLIFSSLPRWCSPPLRLCSLCPSHPHHRFSSHPMYEPPWPKLPSRIPPPSDDSQSRLPSFPLEFQALGDCWVHSLPNVFLLSALAFSGPADVDGKLGVVVSTSMYGYLLATLVPFVGILIALVRPPTAVCSLIPTFVFSGGNLIALVRPLTAVCRFQPFYTLTVITWFSPSLWQIVMKAFVSYCLPVILALLDCYSPNLSVVKFLFLPNTSLVSVTGSILSKVVLYVLEPMMLIIFRLAIIIIVHALAVTTMEVLFPPLGFIEDDKVKEVSFLRRLCLDAISVERFSSRLSLYLCLSCFSFSFTVCSTSLWVDAFVCSALSSLLYPLLVEVKLF